MKVLLAIDESQFATAAAREAEARLTAPGTEVRVLHVVGSFIPPAAALLDSGGSVENVRDNVSNQYQVLVDGVAERFKARGISAEGVVREGDPAKTIVSQAKDWDADLVIIGAHGLTGLKSLIMGNIARHVVDNAHCSVEVVRPKSSD